MSYRQYDISRDRDALHRIWAEIGWIDSPGEEKFDRFLQGCSVIVADANGSAECAALTTPGTFRHLSKDLPFCCVAGITTGRVGRQQGMAQRLTAAALARAADEGAVIAGLSTFEQGFYDRLGFGCAAYDNHLAFDPAQLNVSVRARAPIRLSFDDWQRVHDARMNRLRLHGACNLTSAYITRSDMEWSSDRWGLGYANPDGSLSHYVYIEGGSGTSASVCWMCYQDTEHFLELLALIKSLGDQWMRVKMVEPPGVQMQGCIHRPTRGRLTTENSPFEQYNQARADKQVRICRLQDALANTHLPGPAVRFNLELSDPISKWLEGANGWQGIGGEYTVMLGPESAAERGSLHGVPMLKCTSGSFTRLWMGAVTCTGLALAGELNAPADLIKQLDVILRMPLPKTDWYF